ncbi:MAG: restriction endonuclease [Desulfobacterales bacterium]|nr:restriction endonuclease [Desulfobacterales bacterium]
MARRNSPLNDLFDIAATLSWWAGVGIAIAVFVVLHSIAGTTVAVPTGSAGMGDFAVKSLGITLAKFGQWILPIPLLLGAAASACQRRKRAQLHAEAGGTGGQAAIDGMSWQEFEMLVGEAFRQRGFSALETGGGGADGGVDLGPFEGSREVSGAMQAVAGAQGRRHRRARTLRRDGGTGCDRRVRGDIGHVHLDAIDFAKGRNIDLIDGPKLGVMIRNATRAGEAGSASHKVAAVPDKRADKAVAPQESDVPKCPKCGSDMLKRIAKQAANCRRDPSGVAAPFRSVRGIRAAGRRPPAVHAAGSQTTGVACIASRSMIASAMAVSSGVCDTKNSCS